jgi:hypothetical protein
MRPYISAARLAGCNTIVVRNIPAIQQMQNACINIRSSLFNLEHNSKVLRLKVSSIALDAASFLSDHGTWSP